jgi:hypothetical protein
MRIKTGFIAKTLSSFATALLVFGFATFANRAVGACSLAPERATNTVGQTHVVTATVTTNGSPAGGVTVSFSVISGPNSGTVGSFVTGAGGMTAFSYTGNGGAGTDVIRATGTVSSVAFTCMATQIWVVAGPSIQCPGNIVTNTAAAGCTRSVPFNVVASGTPMPSLKCRLGSTTITSPHPFPTGTNNVICTASNVNGMATCSFVVTVTESEPPNIASCPNDVAMAVLPGETSAVVDYEPPTATDNCGDPSVLCDPPSGSTFPLGVTPVTCIATDSAGNTNACGFAVSVEEGQVEAHDLAVVKIKAPRFVNLTAAVPARTKRVVVTIQNRSPHTEAIFDPLQLEGLVTLTVESLDPTTCLDLTPQLLQGRPQRRLPFNLRPKQKLNLYFDVTFDCAINPAKGLGQEDFRYVAQVHHEAIDGAPDTHPECDVCPRAPLEGVVDPNPNGRIRDKGCGAPVGNGFFGGEVLTDVSVR